MVEVCVPIAVNVAESKGVPFGGEMPLAGLINVAKVTEEIPPLRELVVRELVKFRVPSGAVRPVSVNQRMRVPGTPKFTSILSVSNVPRGRFGVPCAPPWTRKELLKLQQIVAGRVTGLPPVTNV